MFLNQTQTPLQFNNTNASKNIFENLAKQQPIQTLSTSQSTPLFSSQFQTNQSQLNQPVQFGQHNQQNLIFRPSQLNQPSQQQNQFSEGINNTNLGLTKQYGFNSFVEFAQDVLSNPQKYDPNLIFYVKVETKQNFSSEISKFI